MNRDRYLRVRARTTALAAPLEVEDFIPRSLPEANPVRWHLGHTTLFFESEALAAAGITVPGSRPEYRRIFAAGSGGMPRAERSRISRPTVAEVFAYRRAVDEAVGAALGRDPDEAFLAAVRLGIHHEEFHQERLLVDLKHLLWTNPEQPAYRPPEAGTERAEPAGVGAAVPLRFIAFTGGEVGIGHGGGGFAWPQEIPRHRRRVPPFRLASRLATNGEFLEFVEEGGYRQPDLWPAPGRALLKREGVEHPLYWERRGDDWFEFTLRGRRPLDPAAPVTHVSFFEAQAFARWRDARLPTEFEWETAAGGRPVAGCFLEDETFVPGAASPREAGPGVRGPAQLFGTAWEWTTSADLPYPGAPVPSGIAADLGGGFFGGGMVARGGSCLTPAAHVRGTSRRFLAPAARWQVTGIRLARDA